MRSLRRTISDILAVLAVTIVAAVCLKSCIVDAYRIPTASMSGTIEPGDYVLVNKFIYGARTPEKILFIPLPQWQFPKWSSVGRGDVVVFDFPGEPDEVIPVRNQPLVKRCVALPGDTVEISNKNLIINGFREPHSFSQFDTLPFFTVVPYRGMAVPIDTSVIVRWAVFIQREGHLCERRNGSVLIDGTETDTFIVGRNYFFMVGDNAGNSYDSRYWGFVPEENIAGKAMMIYFSKNENGIRWDRIGMFVQ